MGNWVKFEVGSQPTLRAPAALSNSAAKADGSPVRPSPLSRLAQISLILALSSANILFWVLLVLALVPSILTREFTIALAFGWIGSCLALIVFVGPVRSERS